MTDWILTMVRHHTEEECKEAHESSWSQLRKRQRLEPDFEGKWRLGCGVHHQIRRVGLCGCWLQHYGEPVRHATEEDAKRSIKENRADWLGLFGIKGVGIMPTPKHRKSNRGSRARSICAVAATESGYPHFRTEWNIHQVGSQKAAIRSSSAWALAFRSICGSSFRLHI